MIETTISHIAVGLYAGEPTIAVVIRANGERPRAGARFHLAGRDWQVRGVGNSRPYDETPDEAAESGLVALIVDDAEGLLEQQQALAGQTLQIHPAQQLL